MRGLDVSEENLEDLLTYDDLFLDFFNAFLSLPVFSQALYYNRLTGTFMPLEGSTLHEVGDENNEHPYGATDEEREQMLVWAKQRRLPLFLRTFLFREFKLCKLLLRPLEDRGSTNGEQVRGYSRQTESCVSSLSNMADESTNDLDDFNCPSAEMMTRSALFRYQRPGSRALSLPARLSLLRSLSLSSADEAKAAAAVVKRRRRPADSDKRGSSAGGSSNGPAHRRQPASHRTRLDVPDGHLTNQSSINLKIDIQSLAGQSSASKCGKSSSKVTTSQKKSRYKVTPFPDREPTTSGEMKETDDEETGGDEGREELSGSEPYVTFNEDAASERQTDKDLREMEGKESMSLHQMKEQLLASSSGMERFRRMLSQTAGEDLFDFWLDCEYFKDVMEQLDEQENTAIRNILFRDVQDKHRMKLTSEAKRQIVKSSCHAYLSHTIFLHTQYDVLRRLRTYWVARFICHKERAEDLTLDAGPEEAAGTRAASPGCLFPSICLVNSLPVWPEEARHIAETDDWTAVRTGGRTLDPRVRSARAPLGRATGTTPADIQRSLRKKFLMALLKDRDAGGPFLTFLQSHPDSSLLSQLQYWEDVEEYEAAETRSADRMLRLAHAWHIFNRFLAPNCPDNIGVDPAARDLIHQQLLELRDTVAAAGFQSAKEAAVDLMLAAWLRYLKQDLKSFMDCQIRSSRSPPSSAEDLQVLLDENQRLIVRPFASWVQRYPPSTDSERGRRLRTALSVAESIDDARIAEERRRRKEKRKETERERRKSCRAAKLRLLEAKRHKSVKLDKVEENEEDDDGFSEGNLAEEENEEKVPSFNEVINKKGMVALFKKYVLESEGKDVMNLVNFYLDAEAYHKLSTDTKPRSQRDVHAAFIHKTYMEQGARKKIYLNDKVYSRLKTEKDRPKSVTLKEAQHFILPKIDGFFKTFWEMEAQEKGKKLSKVELAMQSDDPGMLKGWQRKGGKGRRRPSESRRSSIAPAPLLVPDFSTGDKPDGRAQPSQEDKVAFLQALNRAVAGPLPHDMLHFYVYLRKYATENSLLIDNDLLFYCEVHKFKEASHSYSDEEMLQRKTQSMLDCYLASTTTPPLQISITSELQQKTMRAAQRYLSGKDLVPSIFDEAQYQLFKDLLPYWAGFVQQYEEGQTLNLVSEKEARRLLHLAEVLQWRHPSAHSYPLPTVQVIPAVVTFTFSLANGIVWRKDTTNVDVASLLDNSEGTRSVMSSQS